MTKPNRRRVAIKNTRRVPAPKRKPANRSKQTPRGVTVHAVRAPAAFFDMITNAISNANHSADALGCTPTPDQNGVKLMPAAAGGCEMAKAPPVGERVTPFSLLGDARSDVATLVNRICGLVDLLVGAVPETASENSRGLNDASGAPSHSILHDMAARAESIQSQVHRAHEALNRLDPILP